MHTEGMSHPEDPQETTQEIDTDTEDTLTEAIAEREEDSQETTLETTLEIDTDTEDTQTEVIAEKEEEATLETTLEIDTDIEDIQIEVIAEKEEEIMKKTGTGRPSMAIKADIERVARSPQVMGGLL